MAWGTDVDAVVDNKEATLEETLHSASQRRVNLIWEITQSVIAITLVVATIIASLWALPSTEILGHAFFLVIGFYFGRTNHTRVGGVQLGR